MRHPQAPPPSQPAAAAPPALRLRVVGDDAEHLRQIRAVIERLPPSDVRFEPERQDDETADLVLVHFDGNEAGLSHVRRYAEATPRPVVAAILEDRSPLVMRKAVRAGADEILFFPPQADELLRVAVKVGERRRLGQLRKGGLICAVASLSGGSGVTTVATNLALALIRGGKKRVAIVDLALQSAGVEAALGLEADHGPSPLTLEEREIDSIRLESTMVRHESGLYVVTPPERLEDSDLVSDVAVGAVLELMRELFDFVVLDCGSHVDENIVTAWERCQRLLYLLPQSLGGARAAVRFAGLFERLALKSLKPEFVVNCYSARHAIGLEHLAQLLKSPVFAALPRDDRLLEMAQLKGQDLWRVNHRAPLARAIEQMAARLAESDEPAPAGAGRVGSFLKRLFPGGVKEARNEA